VATGKKIKKYGVQAVRLFNIWVIIGAFILHYRAALIGFFNLIP